MDYEEGKTATAGHKKRVQWASKAPPKTSTYEDKNPSLEGSNDTIT